MSMKKFAYALFLLTSLFWALSTDTALAAEAKMTRKQYQKNLTYNKNALPYGWKYEAGYTLWRMERNLLANQHTYRKYKRDRAWRGKLHRYNRAEEIVLDSLDWTADEIALFWESYKELFQFYPAGIDD